jgi:transcription antitermination factor NusG
MNPEADLRFQDVTVVSEYGGAHTPAACAHEQWYAARTRSRHEKVVARQLQQRAVECFLPLYQTLRQWRNGRFQLSLPLFPGYLFVRIAMSERLKVLQVPGVVGLVGFNGVATPLPQAEIDTIREALRKGVAAEPYPYLKVGQFVRVVRGPMSGLQGTLVRRKGKLRVVIRLDLIMRSVAMDIDAAEIEPMNLSLRAAG